jgi:hypothetical protein
MAESVHQANHDLHHARDVQRERAAAFWQQAVDEGRIIRQLAALARKEQTEEETEEQSPSQTP